MSPITSTTERAVSPTIWTCTLVDLNAERDGLPDGCDLLMRRAVQAVAERIGLLHVEVFSGWGRSYVPETDMAVLERRLPRHHEAWETARQIIEDVVLHGPLDMDDERSAEALSALTELIYHRADWKPTTNPPKTLLGVLAERQGAPLGVRGEDGLCHGFGG